LLEQLQILLDAIVRAPRWAGYALIGLAALITILGRRGQRPLNAALLGGGAVALALFTLRGALHEWVPGVVAIIGGVLLACLGLFAGAWGTAFVMAAILGGAGALAAHKLGLFWPVGLAPLFGLGLFVGIGNQKPLALALPPVFSAIFIAVGAAIAWAPHQHGAKLWQLNDVSWTLGLALLLLAPLLVLSFERDYRRKRRLAARTRQMEDVELQKRIAAQKKSFDRALH
jgi:hypothetical protein